MTCENWNIKKITAIIVMILKKFLRDTICHSYIYLNTLISSRVSLSTTTCECLSCSITSKNLVF